MKLPKEIKILFRDMMGNKNAGFYIGRTYLVTNPEINYVLVKFYKGFVWVRRILDETFNVKGYEICDKIEMEKLKTKYPQLF